MPKLERLKRRGAHVYYANGIDGVGVTDTNGDKYVSKDGKKLTLVSKAEDKKESRPLGVPDAKKLSLPKIDKSKVIEKGGKITRLKRK